MTQLQVIDKAIEEVAIEKKKNSNEVTSFEISNQLAKQIVGQTLPIYSVTQQSEPLVAFMKYYKNNVPIGTQKSSVEIVKDYLATNGV